MSLHIQKHTRSTENSFKVRARIRVDVRCVPPKVNAHREQSPHQELDHEDDGEVGRKEAHAALLALHAHDGLSDEGQVDEAAVGVAEGEAE